MAIRPAMKLLGLDLVDGWKAIKLIEPKSTDTGSCFSVGYIVRNNDGKEAFLKALDYSRALQSDDPAKELQKLTERFNFERTLLDKCRNKHMSKIVTAIAHGKITVPGESSEHGVVQYIVFEKADGNIRQLYNLSKNIDTTWCLRSLHNSAVALQQLHTHGIAHQDLKPSNVLVFAKDQEFKVADLGRASDKAVPFHYDEMQIAGDPSYAPIELEYNFRISDEFQRKYGIDMYHLGSLIFFYFSDVSATEAIKTKLTKSLNTSKEGKGFTEDLPYIRYAFIEAVNDLRKDVFDKAEDLTDEIINIVQELCEPDPSKRGHPLDRVNNPYSLERYITSFDRLAEKAEVRLSK